MSNIKFPYGNGFMEYDIPQQRFNGELFSSLESYQPSAPPFELVRQALENPIGTKKLWELAQGKENIVLLASDHTRPVPSKVIIPQMLSEIRKGSPDADITILIATGCHRGTTDEELIGKLGEDIFANEKIVVHDCDMSPTVMLGKLPSDADMYINKLAVDAELLVAEGFIEPHFFAGFSGGRKSVLPGVASRETVIYNHNAEFIDSPYSRTGIVENNPIHMDMLHAAREAGLAFICNVVINSEKEAIYAVAGDAELAHKAGREFLGSRCKVDSVCSDIVISTNGGYPLDQNIYQSVKGMTAAEATVKEGGVIIMLSRCNDGHGGEEFYKTFAEEKDLARMMQGFRDTPKNKTRVDQWQSQIFARLLQKARVILISDAPDEMVRQLHMTPACSIEQAVEIADGWLGNSDGKILAIPDGVSVMVV